jgi:hypothetical protein
MALRPVVAAITLVLGLSAGIAHAQAVDRPWYERWYDAAREDLGKALFVAAWPTAEYQGIRLEGITPTPGGVDVTVKVWGRSWLEGAIWTDVIIKFRNYNVDDIAFGRHSATFFAPGETMGTLLRELKHQMGPSPTPALPTQQSTWAVVCVRNASNSPLNYNITWGNAHEARTLAAGDAWIYRAAGGEQDFSVMLDTSLADNVVNRTFRVRTMLFRGDTNACQDRYTYDFTISKKQIGFGPETWTPGAEHPFLRHVYADEEAWSCERGYRWLHPDDDDDLRCIR